MPKKISNEEFIERLKEFTEDSVILESKYINKRTKVNIRCKKCGNVWEISPASLYAKTNFSGCPCCNHKKFYEQKTCSYCYKTFEKLKSTMKNNQSGLVFCCKECGNRYKSLQQKMNNGSNYRRNAFEYYEHCCKICGYREDERILEVHHIDENRLNNDINNLIILCPNCHKKLTLHLNSIEELLK